MLVCYKIYESITK